MGSCHNPNFKIQKMKVFPPAVEEKLGFDVLRARLDTLMLSRLGQERLAHMRLSNNLSRLRTELERVAELQDAFRFDDSVPLDNVLDIRDVIRRAAPEGAYLGPDDLVAVRLVLGTLRKTKQYFESRVEKYPKLVEAVSGITPLQGVEKRISEVVDDDGRVRDNASPELFRLRKLIIRRQAQLRDRLMGALRQAIGLGYATEEQPTFRNGRMVIPIRAEAKRKVQGFVQDTSATGQTVYIEPAECLDLNNEVRELEADEIREIERILRAITALVRENIEAIKEGVKILMQFDLLQAKAHLANQLNAVVPVLNEEGIIDIVQGRNPVLSLYFRRNRELGQDVRNVVPLDLQLGIDYHTLVITGPNAGGKTVAMKTVGLFALMLAFGLPLPVDEKSRFSLFDRLLVDIGDEQSLEEDLSTFSSHIANLKYMLKHANDRTLILIDEAGTGTDPAEGGAIAQAVLERLTTQRARTIATTHHGTLKVFAHEKAGVENGSMEFDQTTLSPTYRYKPGIPGSSYAFDIAQRMGLREQILKRARSLVGKQKTALEELIVTFEARTQEAEIRRHEAEKARKEAEEVRRSYQERFEKLEKERDRIQQAALMEAESIVERANAAVERTIREIKEAQAEKEATKAVRADLNLFKKEVAKRRARAERQKAKRAVRKDLSRKNQLEAADASNVISSPIQIGDQVVLDDGSASAEVVEMDSHEVVVAFESMRIRVSRDRLTKVGGPRKQKVTVRQFELAGETNVSSLGIQSTVDLRGQRVDEALQAVTRLIDEALAANLSSVEILHGKGTGALREAIHVYLAGRRDVKHFEDAPWNQGGAGVTIVTL